MYGKVFYSRNCQISGGNYLRSYMMFQHKDLKLVGWRLPSYKGKRSLKYLKVNFHI